MNTSSARHLLTLAALLALSSACDLNIRVKNGRGEIVTERIQTGEFSRLRVGGNFKVRLVSGSQPMLIVRTHENLVPYIITELRGDELHVYSDYQLKSREGVSIEVSYTQLEAIESAGASSIETAGVHKGENLNLDISGAGSMNLSLEVDVLTVRMSGAGAIRLNGLADRCEIDISGAGGLKSDDLECRICEINLSGVGGAEIHVTEELIARISGIGGITYSGNPTKVDKQVSGLGRIAAAD